MSEREKIFGTIAIGNDDFARATGLPYPTGVEDGGKTFEGNVHLQQGRETAGFNLNVFTPHYDQHANVTWNARHAFASWEAYRGHANTSALSENTSLFTYTQADVAYSDTRAIVGPHNFVHREMTGGRNMAPVYAASNVENRLDVGAAGLAEARREGLKLGRLDVQPSAFVAGTVGTDRAEAAAGARLSIGHNPDGTPRSIPNANPEASGVTYVRAPNQFERGNWSLTATVSQHALVNNRYLRAGESERFDVRRVALEAAYNIRDNVSLTAGYERSDNPVSADYPGAPRFNSTLKGAVTFRF